MTVLADRGFGDHKLFAYLDTLGFDDVIRFRGTTKVTAPDGECRAASSWVGQGGRARKLTNAQISAKMQSVGAVVCVHAKGMKEPWHLATSKAGASASEIIRLYARRWRIETSFRDTKDLRFGMGLSFVHIKEPERRDRLLLLNAFAMRLLTLLGEANDAIGLDRTFKVNTSKRRTHSLFRQGCMHYDLMPTMPEHRLKPLIEKFCELIGQNPETKKIGGLT